MSNKEKLLASAQKFLLKGQVDRAIKDYQKLLELDPKDLRHRQKLGELFSRSGRPEEAIEAFETVARHFVSSGFFLKAIAVYKQMQKLDPGREDICWTLAELNQKQGLTGNAQAEYRTLLAGFEKKGSWSDSLTVLKKMRELEPENVGFRVRFAENSAKAGFKEQCRAELSELSDLLRSRKEFSRLLKLYETFLPLFPQDRLLRLGLAEAQILAGDPAQGEKTLGLLLLEDHEDADALRLLVEAQSRQGNLAAAGATSRRLLEAAPEDLSRRELLVRTCLAAGDAKEAVDQILARLELFLQADRRDVLREFLGRLKSLLPAETASLARLEAALTGRSSGGDRPDAGSADAAAFGSPALLEEFEGEGELWETGGPPPGAPPASAAGNGDQGWQQAGEFECPLDFLENLPRLQPSGKTPPPPAAAASAESGPDQGDEAVLELELELELVEPEAETPTDFPPAATPGAAAETGADEDFFLEDLDAELVEAEEPTPAASDAEIQEAEFYFQQGLLDHAGKICRQVLQDDPKNPEANRLLTAIDARRPVEPEVVPGGESSFVDLTLDLDEEAEPFEFLDPEDKKADGAGAVGGAGETTGFDPDEMESHYNLGIAYKEMGLLADAISEFDQALRSPQRRLDALILKGMCLLERGDFPAAEVTFRFGLALPELSENDRVSLNYEMGLLFEAWGKPQPALASFQQAADRDPFFRDVKDKVQALRKQLGQTEPKAETSKGDRDRVSYV